MEKGFHIGFIGAGKVATNLAIAFRQAGLTIDWVWSRSGISAKELVKETGGIALDSLDAALPSTDLVIISIPDDAVKEVAAAMILQQPDIPVVHTSGSLSMDVLSQHHAHCGVFYPLQTFSLGRIIPLDQVPFCIEAQNENLLNLLNSLALALNGSPVKTREEQRLSLHIAAVFACNFSNYLYSVSDEILTKTGLRFDLLQPLLKETIQKAIEEGPSVVQTGPAFRGDTRLIAKHLQWLEKSPEFKEVYDFLSRKILAKYHNDGKL